MIMKRLFYLLAFLPLYLNAQEFAYTINTSGSFYPIDFTKINDNIYIIGSGIINDYEYPVISKISQSNYTSVTKAINNITDFTSYQDFYIQKCNLSNDLILIMTNIDFYSASILKFDEDLNLIWSKKITLPENIYFNSYGSNATPLTITENDEIIVFSTISNMILFTKIDSNGELIFSKKIVSTYPIDGKNPGFSFFQTNDQGFLLTMKNSSYPTIIKLDSQYNVQWAKLWTIDTYSHPKLCSQLPDGNFLIIGEGDNGTYLAKIDQSGNILSYKAGIYMTYPFHIVETSNEQIKIIDYYGKIFKMNQNNNAVSLKTPNNSIYNIIPKINENTIDLLDNSSGMNLVFNLENETKNCYNYTEETISTFELPINENNIFNESITVSNLGTLVEDTFKLFPTTNVNLVENCNPLNIDENVSSITKLYPNPSSSGSTIVLETNFLEPVHIELSNNCGQILERFYAIEMSHFEFKIEQSSGMYFIKLFDENRNQLGIEKLIIE